MEAKVSTENVRYDSTVMEMRSYKNNYRAIVCSYLFITPHSRAQAHIHPPLERLLIS